MTSFEISFGELAKWNVCVAVILREFSALATEHLTSAQCANAKIKGIKKIQTKYL